jgi:hypothetical protein
MEAGNLFSIVQGEAGQCKQEMTAGKKEGAGATEKETDQAG